MSNRTLPICEELRAMARDPIGCGLVREWPVNPQGYEAASLIEELYEALERALENIQGCLEGEDLPSIVIMNKAKAALEKARGEQ